MRTLNATGFYKPTGEMKYLEHRESRERPLEFTPEDFGEAAVMGEQTALDDALGDIGKSEAPKRHAAAPFLLFAAPRLCRKERVSNFPAAGPQTWERVLLYSLLFADPFRGPSPLFDRF